MPMDYFRAGKWTVGLFLGLAVSACSSGTKTAAVCVPSERPLPPDRISGVLAPNIVQIKSDSSLGSGFLLASDDEEDVLIVTNYHVVAEGENFEVEFVRSNNKHVKVGNVEIVKTLPEDDLALLKAPRIQGFGRGLELAKSVQVGESVATLGYPVLKNVSVEPKLSSGLITSTSQTAGDRRFLLTSLALMGGNSGGAAVNSCGRVTGVASAYLTEAHEIGMLVPVDRVTELVKRYATPRAEPRVEIGERLALFARTLQHEEGRAASTYFSRTFYRNVVFPSFRESMGQLSEKRERLQALFDLLKRRGLDLDSMSEEQQEQILAMFNLQYTPSELEMLQIVYEANTNEWDAYKTLQAYFAPFLGDIFGSVKELRIQEVKGASEEPTVYLSVQRPDGRQHFYQVTMVHEWGDWQISGIKVPSDAAERSALIEEPVGRREASRQSPSDSDWVPARKAVDR